MITFGLHLRAAKVTWRFPSNQNFQKDGRDIFFGKIPKKPGNCYISEMPIIQPKIQEIRGEKLIGTEIPGQVFSKCKPAFWVQWKLEPTLSLRRSHVQPNGELAPGLM